MGQALDHQCQKVDRYYDSRQVPGSLNKIAAKVEKIILRKSHNENFIEAVKLNLEVVLHLHRLLGFSLS
jgi:hypothetical protein